MPVPVPRDDLGALAGVGRREEFADERVEQGRLAGFHLAGDRHAQWLVETLAEAADLVDLCTVPANTSLGVGQHVTGLVDQRHRRCTSVRAGAGQREGPVPQRGEPVEFGLDVADPAGTFALVDLGCLVRC